MSRSDDAVSRTVGVDDLVNPRRHLHRMGVTTWITIDYDPWDDEGGGEGGEGGEGGPLETEEEGCFLIGVTLQPDRVRPGAQTTVVVQLSSAGPDPWVSFSAAAVANSGGHSHTGGRPLGQFGTTAGEVTQTTYTASAFGGAETISVDACGATRSAGLTVEVPGLVRLVAGTNYTFDGATATHPFNRYGTAGANAALVSIANAYAAQYPGSTLDYNDQSLLRGGLFDIGPPYGTLWDTPHAEHRLGSNSDVDRNLVPPDRHADLEQIFVDNGSPNFRNEGNHWHLRF